MASEKYYQKSGSRPRSSLLRALQYFEEHPPAVKKALDLGCGNGRDTFALLEAGWEVMAIDVSQEAIAHIQANIDPAQADQLTLVCGSFEQTPWEEYSLINAGFSLPFCPSSVFAEVWKSLIASISEEGLFTGQLFGKNDGWQQLVLFSKEEVEYLFEGFEWLYFEEQDFDRKTVSGKQKRWHVFELTAQKTKGYITS
jgi:tellurite methyltransferase